MMCSHYTSHSVSGKLMLSLIVSYIWEVFKACKQKPKVLWDFLYFLSAQLFKFNSCMSQTNTTCVHFLLPALIYSDSQFKGLIVKKEVNFKCIIIIIVTSRLLM